MGGSGRHGRARLRWRVALAPMIPSGPLAAPAEQAPPGLRRFLALQGWGSAAPLP